MHRHPGRDLIADDGIEVFTLACRVEEQEDRPTQGNADQEDTLAGGKPAVGRADRASVPLDRRLTRLGPDENDHGDHEQHESSRSVGRGVTTDHEPGEAQCPWGPSWRACLTEGNAGADHRDHKGNAPDRRENAEIANQGILREVLDQART